jgi:ligand-binding sensor domain-containing protein
LCQPGDNHKSSIILVSIRVQPYASALRTTPLSLFTESPNFRFSSADLNKQLSQKTIRKIHQDSTGYLWVVTQEGLSRYNGYKLMSFVHDPLKSDSLSSDNVRAVIEDNNNRLWVATDGGGLKFI